MFSQQCPACVSGQRDDADSLARTLWLDQIFQRGPGFRHSLLPHYSITQKTTHGHMVLHIVNGLIDVPFEVDRQKSSFQKRNKWSGLVNEAPVS